MKNTTSKTCFGRKRLLQIPPDCVHHRTKVKPFNKFEVFHQIRLMLLTLAYLLNHQLTSSFLCFFAPQVQPVVCEDARIWTFVTWLGWVMLFGAILKAALVVFIIQKHYRWQQWDFGVKSDVTSVSSSLNQTAYLKSCRNCFCLFQVLNVTSIILMLQKYNNHTGHTRHAYCYCAQHHSATSTNKWQGNV